MLGNADPSFDFNNDAVLNTIGFAVYENESFTVFHAPAGWGAGTAAAPGMDEIITTDALTATGAIGESLSALADVGDKPH